MLTTKLHYSSAIIGFFIVLAIILQLITGIMLAFSLVPEPMMIPLVRDEEDVNVAYIDIIFFSHERGVDLLFLVFYAHLLRKVYIEAFYLEQETNWKSGIFAFLIFHVVVFFGLVLCCTHLSDITLSIACNIFHTFFMFLGKPYAFIFPGKKLNTDTIIRLAYLHYITAFYLIYLGVIHAVDMHYDWSQDYNWDALQNEVVWFDEALANELYCALLLVLGQWLIGLLLFNQPEALSYEIFMWGDIGAINDVRFYGVAPHWYFRPFMAWLTACPYHKTGVFGLLLFFLVLYNQPTLVQPKKQALQKNLKGGNYEQKDYNKIKNPYSFSKMVSFWFFIMFLMYTTTFLPAGRYYQVVWGNIGMLLAYFLIISYLLFYNLRGFKKNNLLAYL